MYINLVLSVLLLSATVMDATAKQAPSDNLLNFLSVLHGDFSNQKQTKYNDAKGENHPPISITCKPVEVPALSPSITFFYEEAVNGAVNERVLFAVSEDNSGIIRLQRYNLPGQYSPGSYDLNQLNDLEASDLVTYTDCDILYEAVDSTVFMGTWPNCYGEGATFEAPPNYVVLLTCTSFAFHSPEDAAETSERLPNDVDRDNKYALLPYMFGERQDFVDPCDN